MAKHSTTKSGRPGGAKGKPAGRNWGQLPAGATYRKTRPGDDADGLETPRGAYSPKGAAAWAERTRKMNAAANPGRTRKA